MYKLKSLLIQSLVATTVALSGCNETEENPMEEVFEESNCFWTGPYVRENPVTNIAYPDTGAKYWAANFAMPEGASLTISGNYMYNRYMSFNTYDINGSEATYSPVDNITDVNLEPNSITTINPYIEGNNRNEAIRDYSFEVLTGEPIEGDPALYSNADFGERATIVLRSYVENEDAGATGGVALPAPQVTLANGTILNDVQAICESLDVDSSIVNIPLIPPADYDNMTAFGNPYQKGFNATKENPATLIKAFTFPENIACDWFGACTETPDAQPGFYANLDNQYVFGMTTSYRPTIVSETSIGLPEGSTPTGKVTVGYEKDEALEVAVFRGKLPITPKTRDGQELMDTGTDMRYWSFCTNEYMSQKVTECVFDEDVLLDSDGYYTIAIGLPEDRPENAIEDCGINWVPTSLAGDGYLEIIEQEINQEELDPSELTKPNALGQDRKNVPSQNMVIVRNMLPSETFPHAIQNVTKFSETAEVMGEYAIKYHYESKSEFEARGCN